MKDLFDPTLADDIKQRIIAAIEAARTKQ